MQGFLIALRALHYTACIALFGEFLFFLVIALPALRVAQTRRTDPDPRHRLVRGAFFWLSLAVASGAGWLVAQAASMSGSTFVGALQSETLVALLTKTQFGRVWMVRGAMAIGLGVALALAHRRSSRDRWWPRVIALLAGALLGSLAWGGHANAEEGIDRPIHLGADAIHLLAAGAWLGGLLPLALLFANARSTMNTRALTSASTATRRFSLLGMVSVAALVVTGIVNTQYIVGSVPALFGTDYGQWLLLKLALFVAMLTFAAFNRERLTPRLAKSAEAGQRAVALTRLQRNAACEVGLGLVLLAVVGALGVTPPSLHEGIVWPFAWTLDPTIGKVRMLVLVGASIAIIGGAIGIATLGGVGRAVAAVCIATCLVVGALLASPFVVSANPMSYAQAPDPYTVDAIARGAPLYATHCASCHGESGYGGEGGKRAGAMRNLATHWVHRREGDLAWSIRHGIADKGMPGFEGRLDDAALWDVMHLLHAHADAESADPLTAEVDASRSVVPPDFAFQVGAGSQESLSSLRGRRMVLLVLYAWPASRERLLALQSEAARFAKAGVRVIALPADPRARSTEAVGDQAMFADGVPSLAAVYTMFGREDGKGGPSPTHQEFLIDAQGNLRACWTPGDRPGWERIDDLLRQVALLSRMKPMTPMATGHMH